MSRWLHAPFFYSVRNDLIAASQKIVVLRDIVLSKFLPTLLPIVLPGRMLFAYGNLPRRMLFP